MSQLLLNWGVLTALVAFALCVGSFLNVVVYRLPRMQDRDFRREAAAVLAEAPTHAPVPDNFNLSVPRSRCTTCGRMVRGHENIPVLSWLWLRGRCAGCGSAISVRYPIVEAFTAVLSVIVAVHFAGTLVLPHYAGVTVVPAQDITAVVQCALALIFTWWLIALAAIDLDTGYLPDALTLPLLWLGLVANVFATFVPLDQAVWGAVLGYLALWSVYWMFKLVTGKEGFGYGDFKLLAALGAWLGWHKLLAVIIISSAVGAVVGIALIMLKRSRRDSQIPFGPFLAAAGWIVMLLPGDDFVSRYTLL